MIYLFGDTHGEMEMAKLCSRYFPEGKTLTKDDYVIVLGDFGLIFDDPQSSSEKYWLEQLEKKPFTTLFVDGNHENHPKINELETVQMFGSDVGKVNDSVFHLRRGRTYTIDNKKILTIGGAYSIDRPYRVKDKSWWPGELLSTEEMDRIDNITGDFDYVLTHTAPNTIIRELGFSPVVCNVAETLELLKDRITFKHWYFGHFHLDKELDKYTCVYKNIIKI